jgi:hypothetical protein
VDAGWIGGQATPPDPRSFVEWFRDWTTQAMRWAMYKLYRDIPDVQEASIRVRVIIVTGL